MLGWIGKHTHSSITPASLQMTRWAPLHVLLCTTSQTIYSNLLTISFYFLVVILSLSLPVSTFHMSIHILFFSCNHTLLTLADIHTLTLFLHCTHTHSHLVSTLDTHTHTLSPCFYTAHTHTHTLTLFSHRLCLYSLPIICCSINITDEGPGLDRNVWLPSIG